MLIEFLLKTKMYGFFLIKNVLMVKKVSDDLDQDLITTFRNPN